VAASAQQRGLNPLLHPDGPCGLNPLLHPNSRRPEGRTGSSRAARP
jgi:hypothetical protein